MNKETRLHHQNMKRSRLRNANTLVVGDTSAMFGKFQYRCGGFCEWPMVSVQFIPDSIA